ncbi:MAG: ComEC/Rec2 family competence protein [Clostridium fessum]
MLGDKSGLSEELRERFQDNGIAHILAVSGLHVSLIGMSVYSALRFWGISYGWAGLGASALLTFYGFVTGLGASVFRAVFMVEVSCLAAYLGRELRSAECAVAVFDFAGVAVASICSFRRDCSFPMARLPRLGWRRSGCGKREKEKRAGRGGTRERKKERI